MPRFSPDIFNRTRFENTDLADFTQELKVQHDEARKLVARMASLSKAGSPDVEELRSAFDDFRSMISAHAAWEETVLFPAMEGTWSDKELNALKESQEEDEKRLFGDDAVKKVTVGSWNLKKNAE